MIKNNNNKMETIVEDHPIIFNTNNNNNDNDVCKKNPLIMNISNQTVYKKSPLIKKKKISNKS